MVKILEIKNDKSKITSEIPQGTILGTDFHILYQRSVM